MGVSITWQPAKKNKRDFRGGTSNDLEALRRAFGQLPFVLGPDDVPKLEGIAAAGNAEFFQEIICTIDSVGEIEIGAQW